MTATLYVGDCREVMSGIEPDSFDAIVTDPPYGLEFMGKDWDKLGAAVVDDLASVGGFQDGNGGNPFSRSRIRYGSSAQSMQRWHESWAVEAFRVLKPGAYCLTFGGTRTVHRLTSALEDAGFEIRDQLVWLHGQGFPKNLDVSKALLAAPTCRCGITEVGLETDVDASLPLEFSGATVGTEPGAMTLAGLSADEAPGIGLESGAGSLGRQRQMDGGIEVFGGQLDPVVLGTSHVAVVAESDKVAIDVCSIQANPEPLRNQVMNDELIGAATIDACPVTFDDPLCNDAPASTLVLPLATAPGGIVGAGHAEPIIGGHAIAGTVDSPGGVADEITSADLANERLVAEGDAVLHTHNYTAERQVLARCDKCGLPISDKIPSGLGTALKPAHEPIIVARKPLIGTVAANVTKHGTGALNIDGCRIEHDGRGVWGNHGQNPANHIAEPGSNGTTLGTNWNNPGSTRHDAGRWPANVVLDEEAAAMLDEQSGERSGDTAGRTPRVNSGVLKFGDQNPRPCHATANVKSDGYTDSGGASRFFYTAKASRSERNIGLQCTCYNQAWEKQDRKANILPETVIPPRADIIESISVADSDSPMTSNGKESTGQFPTDSKSTIPISTNKTTTSPTSKSSMTSPINEFTQDALGLPMADGSSLAESAENTRSSTRKTGISVRKVGRSTVAAESVTSESSSNQNEYDSRNKCPNCGNYISSSHPTVKPIDLMQWLCRLVTQPGGRILDPFCGSGSTGIAAAREGFAFTGIDQSAEYIEISRRRIAGDAPLFNTVEVIANE